MITQSAVPFAADVLLRVTLVLGTFSGAGYLLRRREAALRHLVWSLAIAGSVAIPLLSLVNPFTVPVLPPRSVDVPASAPATPRREHLMLAAQPTSHVSDVREVLDVQDSPVTNVSVGET